MEPSRSEARPLRILVTGAAGLVGREVCAALARRGHAVTGLVHRTPLRLHGVAELRGDVTAPGLGAPDGLPGELDLVVHCAATTAFNTPEAEHRRVNLGGTARVLDVASGGPALLHVSTAYVCGDRAGPIAEAPSDAERFTNAYEASKAEAEAQVRATCPRAAIARPSIVVGHSANGAVGAFGNLYQLLRLVADGHLPALPASPGASLDLVPIDHVAEGLADIAERMGEAGGRIVHLASGAPVPLALLEQVGREYPGLAIPRFVAPGAFDPAGLPPSQRAVFRRVAAHYASYLRPSPLFATDNLRALSGRVCPATGAPFLRRLIAYAVEAGFLGGGFQRTSG